MIRLSCLQHRISIIQSLYPRRLCYDTPQQQSRPSFFRSATFYTNPGCELDPSVNHCEMTVFLLMKPEMQTKHGHRRDPRQFRVNRGVRKECPTR